MNVGWMMGPFLPAWVSRNTLLVYQVSFLTVRQLQVSTGNISYVGLILLTCHIKNILHLTFACDERNTSNTVSLLEECMQLWSWWWWFYGWDIYSVLVTRQLHSNTIVKNVCESKQTNKQTSAYYSTSLGSPSLIHMVPLPPRPPLVVHENSFHCHGYLWPPVLPWVSRTC